MTGTDVITRVREQLSDQTVGYRWSAATLLLYLNDGRREIVRLHPEAAYVTAITVTALAEQTDLAQDIALTDNFVNALMHYVCHRVMLEDSENAGNLAVSQAHSQLFEKEMG